MNARQQKSRLPFCAVLAAVFLIGAAGTAAAEAPDWVNGTSARYPEKTYLTGVGFGDSRQAAESSAYAALARIFRSDIRTTTEAAERFQQREKGEKAPVIDRTIDIQNQTEVTSKVVLEQVRIAERWINPETKVHFALAALRRNEAALSFRKRFLDAEASALRWEKAANAARDPLEKVRALSKAITAAKAQARYASYLRVIDPVSAGGGTSNAGYAAALEEARNRLVRRDFRVSVEMTGPHAADIRAALLEALNGIGLVSGPNGRLRMICTTRFETAGPRDPVWRYVRWTTNLTAIYTDSGVTLGTVHRSGREGQLSSDAAEAKAAEAVKASLRNAVVSLISRHLFGESSATP